jgi:hypothetical protein
MDFLSWIHPLQMIGLEFKTSKSFYNSLLIISFCVQRNFGTYRGLILRSQLIVMLQHKLFNETAENWSHRGDILKYFRDAYPRYPTIQQVHISYEERRFTVDLRPILNPASYTALHVRPSFHTQKRNLELTLFYF